MQHKKPTGLTPKQSKMIQEALALHQSGQLDAAETQYKKLLNFLPSNINLLTNLGTIALQKGKLEDGVRIIGKSLQINPNQPNALNNRGVTLKELKRLDEALASYDRAIVLKPDNAETYSNRGVTLQDLKRLDEALASYDRAIVLKPDNAEANWNKSLLKILTGDYLEGWQLYEWRWKKEPLINSLRVYKQPLWLGTETLLNKTLLIYPEQGLGDYIQCIRYAVLVEQLGAKVILEVPLALMSLVSTLKGQFTLVESGKPLPDFDYHCPVMSLPLAFKTTVDTIPVQLPYLYADEDKKQQWQEKLGNKTVTRKGLVWSGSTIHKNDHNRSLLLQQLASLLELPVEFHSLQKEVRAVDIKTLTDFPHIHQHQEDLLDFADTAALVDAMDIIISVDTSVAHLAGAMGKKVCVLLPYAPDYRWMLDRTDSPWYPTATLFRQPAIDDWESVVAEIREVTIKLN
jgi:tetratricopeptide (TPR) repeat protein